MGGILLIEELTYTQRIYIIIIFIFTPSETPGEADDPG